TARGSGNRVYFGTGNGIYAFAALPKGSQEVPLAWTNIDLVDGARHRGQQTSSDFSVRLLREIEEDGTLVLKHHQNNVRIGFAKLDYAVPEQHIYLYRLLGHDTTWHILQGQNSQVRYSDLPPGDYVFQAMTTDADDSWQ